MEMKKKLRAFFTLARKGDGGFTLVELIVVIAIIAILGGVATVGYSGYVKKANMQADITLASEIEQALILAHYSGTLTPGTSVVVYYGDTDVSVGDESANAAMVATFGEGYAESLRLKYDGWSADLGVITNGEMIEHVNNSAFNSESKNVENLLDSIQYITDELSGVLGSGGVSIDENSGLGIYLTNAGINLSDSVAASNATTLYVADKIANSTDLNDADALASFTTAWQSMDIGHFNNMYESDAFSSNAAHYAQVLALATYVDNQTAGTDAETHYVSLLGSDSGAQGKEILTNVNTVLGSIAQNNATEAGAYMTSDQSKSDAMAFLTYMNGIASSADSLFEDTDLNSEHYYNDGTLLNYVTDYMVAANALQNSGITAQDSVFVFIYNPNSKNIVSCVPEDY